MIYKTTILFAIWLLLSESLSPLHVGIGLVAAFAVAWANEDRSRSPVLRRVPPLRLLQYLPWLLGRILLSGLRLSWLILDPRLPIAPKMIHHRTELSNEAAVVLLGNSITLTPGTVTVDVTDHEIIVHAIDERAADDLIGGRFEEKIARVFASKEASQ